ncbi:MAG: zinc ribbon domain-containing protein [Oscillospiraceae bacterium]|nr:zinc ribbon domain-containing protein [Oscillospiraceae bacterium]
MICTKCGNNNSDGAKVCSTCGAPLNQQPQNSGFGQTRPQNNGFNQSQNGGFGQT